MLGRNWDGLRWGGGASGAGRGEVMSGLVSKFSYRAVDGSGNERTGELDAPTLADAVESVRREGLFPVGVWPAPAVVRLPAALCSARAESPVPERTGRCGAWARLTQRAPPTAQLAVFTRQLATLLGAGLPLARALQILERQQRSPGFRAALREIVRALGGGRDFSTLLRENARWFPPLYASMARAGEASGRLGPVLGQLARLLEKAERLKGRVRAALCYPLVVSAVTAAIVVGLLVFVVPKFQVIFSDLLRGAPLPVLTQAVLGASQLVREHVWILLGGALACAIALAAVRRTRPWQRALLSLPVFGALLQKSAVARSSRTLATLLSGGVPILQALAIAQETAGNVVVAEVLARAQDRVREGSPLSVPLAASKHFPPMAASMVAVGEETGELAAMLEQVADAYDVEVDAAASGLTSVLEPALIVVLAAVVGTIVIALFLPIVRILQVLGG